MPKAKGKRGKGRALVAKLPDAVSDEEYGGEPDPASREFVYDEVDEFHHKRDKILLEEAAWQGREESEDDEEVLGLGLSEDDDEEDEMASDVEERQEDWLPDSRAWGKRKGTFYSGDKEVDEQKRLEGEEEEAAALEEQEAKEIQKRLMQELDEADFGFDLILPVKKAEDEAKGETEEKIRKDFSRMNKKEKLELLRKESPEFLEIIHDFKEKMTELQVKLSPLLKLANEGKISSSGAEYVRTKCNLITNYCTNVTYYLLLKAKRVPIQSHPILKRLLQFRHLLKQLEEIDSQVAPQIESILAKIAAGEEIPTLQNNNICDKLPKKKLKILDRLSSQPMDEVSKKKRKMDEVSKKKRKMDVELPLKESEEDEESEAHDDRDDEDDYPEPEGEEEGEKRGITFEMAKNRGHTAQPRKKERRNPRMKHRTQYKKAVMRRRGQVRDTRHEIQQYGGERTGIKAGVVKSVKIKV